MYGPRNSKTQLQVTKRNPSNFLKMLYSTDGFSLVSVLKKKAL